ncbi:17S U2 SnRNP complex component HTATSF1 isoform X2 [Anoplolepis gracilipes]|uniref:17S U2 SnRNP complex component HTATSF1 isoform X2 n=1 Tax=Anoplolepis gracilipes TaxID=354296 RepID=UPI003B9FEC71
MADSQSVTENTEESEKQEDLMKNYEFDGQTYIYTDKATNITYRFDQENNKWVVKEDDKVSSDNKESSDGKKKEENSGPEVSAAGTFGFENDTHTYTDPNDGSVYFWDKEKNAWFPKVDQDFMARYQMSYGFVDTSEQQPNPPEPKQPLSPQTTKEEKEQRRTEAKRKAQEPPTWFEVDEAHNTAIYVSGLPLDITMDELTALFTKCGLIARDEKGKDKIKLYKDGNGEPKGDALCTYIKVESVDLALKILDGSQIRGKTLSVQRAKFQMKGAYDPALKPKRKKKDKERQKKMQEKLFDWRPERMRGEPLKCERVVILKNLFAPEDFDKEVQLLLEYQQDIRSECLKCGDVRKVVIYDLNRKDLSIIRRSKILKQ